MTLRINFKSSKPVHLQVVDQIRTAAATGALRPGEALPSIGSFAEELRVNLNSVSRAYSELEGLRVIEAIPGKGHFLKDHSPLRRNVRRKQLMMEIDQTVIQSPKSVRRTLTYSLLTVLLAVLYFGLVGSIGMLLVKAGVIRGAMAAVLSTVAIAAVVMPVRRHIQQFVHRFVFAKRYELARALEALKSEATLHPDLDCFMQRAIERTEAVFHARLELITDYGEMLALVNSFPALSGARAPLSDGAGLVMPVSSGEELVGVLRLVGKPAGQEYDAEDLEFLAAVAEQVAIAGHQSRLQKERHEAELSLEIQRGLLPRETPRVPGFLSAAVWQPARTVGGDYYDVFKLGETELALVIADVSGKGIPAALLMASLQATVKAYATAGSTPEDVCAKVNHAISSSITIGNFITFFYAVLDSSMRRLTYANAGHNPPLLARQDGSCLKLATGGAVLGIFPEGTYEQAVVDILAGDCLVLFTDGITEAANSNQEEFGEERLIEILRKNSAASAPDLRDAIMQSVTQFCREDFADDATLLTVTQVRSAEAP